MSENINPQTEEKPTKSFKNQIKDKKKIIKQYLQEKDYAIKLRQVKINNWIKNEELYNGVTQRTLLTRSNLHLPVVFEGVQNMSSKIGKVPTVDFDTVPEGNENASDIMKHVVHEDLKDSCFDLVYENSKTECGIYGRTIYEVIPGNDKQTVELVDTLSFLISPIAKNTKEALYSGRQFIFKTLEQIKDEADKMEYDEEEIWKLETEKVPSEDQRDSSTEASLKNIRLSNMGLANVTQYGSKVCEITKWFTYIVEDEKAVLYELLVANDIYLLRKKKASELGLDRPPYVSWGTFTRGITFWCPSVADIYRDPNLCINVLMNQQVDNNTYRNFGQMFVSSSSGLKQNSIVPRPLGVTVVQTAPNEKVQDKVWQYVPAEITTTPNTISSVKGYADSASGLGANVGAKPKGKMNTSEQAKLQAEIDAKIEVMKRNATLAFEELCQLMSDITAKKMTKPRQVKIFGFKDLTLEDVTKENFQGVKLVANALPSEDSTQNKQIKQKAKLDLYELFKDDPKVPGQLALRRSVAKTFDISPDEMESWFSGEDEKAMLNSGMNLNQTSEEKPGAPVNPGTNTTMNENSALLGNTQTNSQREVPRKI